jgi:hypothetical protein
MNNYRVFLTLAMGFFLFTIGCAGGAPHAKYRGAENAPHMQITPLRADPNVMATMSPSQRANYLRGINDYNLTLQNIAYTNAYTAYSEKQWVNDPEGGPPAPPVSLGGQAGRSSRSRSSNRGGIMDDAKKTASRETQRFVRDTMRTTSRTTSREVSNEIRDAIQGIFH